MRMDNNKGKTVIRIAGVDVPVHLAWKKIESLNTGADLLEKLNEKYPQLASEFTHEVIPIVRQRITETIADVRPPPKADVGLLEFLLDKLATEDPLEVVDMAKQEKGVEISLEDLVYLVGEKTYMDAMTKQASLYFDNKIAPDQIATLWNQAALPAPGKQHWIEADVKLMLALD